MPTRTRKNAPPPNLLCSCCRLGSGCGLFLSFEAFFARKKLRVCVCYCRLTFLLILCLQVAEPVHALQDQRQCPLREGDGEAERESVLKETANKAGKQKLGVNVEGGVLGWVGGEREPGRSFLYLLLLLGSEDDGTASTLDATSLSGLRNCGR